jgi:hypothetical protein
MGGDGSTPGRSRLREATCLIATLSAAGRLPPPPCSVTSQLLVLYCKCTDNSGWERVLYDARGGMEKIIFIRKTEPMPAPTVPAPPHKHGCPASARRQARDKRRKEAWAERRRNRTQPRLHTHSTEDDNTPRPVSAVTAITPVATSPSPQVLPSQPASPPPTVSPQPAPPLRKRAKKRQILQINGCCSPPLPPPPPSPSPSPPSQPAIEFDDEPPMWSETSSVLLLLQAPVLSQALLPRRAPSWPVTAPGISAPASPAIQPAEISPSSTPGYTLIMIWCPSCKKNLIDYRCGELGRELCSTKQRVIITKQGVVMNLVGNFDELGRELDLAGSCGQLGKKYW